MISLAYSIDAEATGRPVIEFSSLPDITPWVVCPASVAAPSTARIITGVTVVRCKVNMKMRWRHFAICAMIAAGSVAGARLLSTFRFFKLLNLKAFDAQFVLRGRQPVSGVTLIVADQKAIDTFPELRILWHPYYAEAIRAAGEAGSTGIRTLYRESALGPRPWSMFRRLSTICISA